jgi:hypothetical protein
VENYLAQRQTDYQLATFLTKLPVRFSDLLGNGDGDVVHRQPAFQEEVLAHVRQGGGGVEGVIADSVSFEVGSSIPALVKQLGSCRVDRSWGNISLGRFINILLCFFCD